MIPLPRPPGGARLPGDHRRGVPPVPIPNTAVKPSAANGSRTTGPARVGRCRVMARALRTGASGLSVFWGGNPAGARPAQVVSVRWCPSSFAHLMGLAGTEEGLGQGKYPRKNLSATLASLYVGIHEQCRGRAPSASENGPCGSSEEADGAWDLRRRGAAATLGQSRQGVSRASYARDNKADRPVCDPRHRPRTEARVSALCLVKLEPLTES